MIKNHHIEKPYLSSILAIDIRSIDISHILKDNKYVIIQL